MSRFSISGKHNWIPLVFLVFGLSLVLLLGAATQRNDRERISLETRITAEQLKVRLESCFQSRAALVRTLSSYPWRSRDELLATWNTRASALLPLYSGVQALNYVDTAGVIRAIYPVDSNRPALNVDLRKNENPSVRQALQQAQESGEMTRTRIVELLQSGRGFALYRQIRDVDGTPVGFVNGVFRIDALMDSCLPDGRLRENFSLAFFDGETAFYSWPDASSGAHSAYQVALPIAVTGSPWRFLLAPREAYLAATQSIVEEIWIALVSLLIVLLAVAVRYALIKQRDIEFREDQYRLLVENQTDLVVKVDMQGTFQYVSPSYCETFGKSEGELLGKAFMPLVHEDDRELTERSLQRLKQPPHTAYHEQRAMTGEGWRWLAWSNRAVLDDAGNMVGITAVGRDVTDIKRLEERIAHMQKMRALGEMAGGITHDFNNLLQVILGNIEILLLDAWHDAETRSALERVRDIAGRAMSLTAKLATLSRQEITRPDNLDIRSLLRDLEGLLSRTLPATVDLRVTPGEAPLMIHGDRAQLEQVLLNLCFNARDAIGENGRISIGASRQTVEGPGPDSPPELPPGDYVLIVVEDNGHGIESEVLPRVFDPFFTTKATDMGTGLGLANCYSIVQQHGGVIAVESTPDEGSRFAVYLPEALQSETSLESTPVATPAGDDTAGGMVLVADDNAQLLQLTCTVLDKAGMESCAAADGRQALELFEANKDRIRLVVLDLVMPDMGGLEVAERIRAISNDVRVLFVSGYVPEHVQRTLSDPVLKKPYTVESFMQAVRRLV